MCHFDYLNDLHFLAGVPSSGHKRAQTSLIYWKQSLTSTLLDDPWNVLLHNDSVLLQDTAWSSVSGRQNTGVWMQISWLGIKWQAHEGSISHTLTILWFSHAVNQVFPILTTHFAVGGFPFFFTLGNTVQCALDLSVWNNDPFVHLLDFYQELLNNEAKRGGRYHSQYVVTCKCRPQSILQHRNCLFPMGRFVQHTRWGY